MMRPLRLFESFNPLTGELRCGGGTSLEEILEAFVPQGWFPPVVPGTKFVTVGGAIANDIHGKNHHIEGTWGNHTKEITLLRSDSPAPVNCSRTENPEVFAATIGGLGLTGIITSATIQLKKIGSSWLETESIPFGSIEEFFLVNESSDSPNTVSWVDLCAKGAELGRGIYMKGDFSEDGRYDLHRRSKLAAPMVAPNFALNPWTVKAFNWAYQAKAKRGSSAKLSHYNPFFFPLDAVGGWNKIYGKRGFYQYQSVIPMDNAMGATREMLGAISASGEGSFLAVMKTFGSIPSPGLLSFPKEGFTLALDFPNNGEKTERLFSRLDSIVREAKGRLYPAKDNRMSKEAFQEQYPDWVKVEGHRDPKINSSFWRRTTGQNP
jgi:FAD/FMN-containing dehydrogenase